MSRVVGVVVAIAAAVFLSGVATLAWGVGPWVSEARAGKARPDLIVSSPGSPPNAVRAGGGFATQYTVKNKGRAKAAPSTTGFYLSVDESKGGDVRVGGSPTRSLKPKRSTSGQAVLEVPEAIPLGDYYLLTCADDPAKVRESNEKNNCRVAASKVKVEEGIKFPLVPDPLNVTPTLDGSRQVTKHLETGGGTVTATADDGTVFTLSLPSNALLSPEEIIMTPVSGVGGLPLSGGLVAAVDLKPDGLQLMKPAKLTIKPPGSVPLEEQTGFSYHADGEDFHLQPLDFGAQLSFSLTHFSAYGVGRGTDADRAAQQKRYPLRTKAQYDQLANEAILPARQALILGVEDDSDWEQEVRDYSIPYYRQVVKPVLQQAETDDALAEKALQVGVQWVRQIQMLGLEDDPEFEAQIEEIFVFFQAIFENAINKSFGRCVNAHDVSEVSRMLVLERTSRIFGLNLGVDAFDKADRCSRFELDVDISGTQLNGTNDTSGWVDVRVDALPIRLTLNGLKGEVNPTYSDWNVQDTQDDQCVAAYAKAGTEVLAPFEVNRLDIGFNLREERAPDGSLITTTGPPTIALHVSGGSTREISTATYCNGFSEQAKHTIYDSASFAAHAGQPKSEISGSPLIREWDFLGGGTHWASTKVSGSYDHWAAAHMKGTGTASYVLRHTPVP